jgi:hypothetical protein
MVLWLRRTLVRSVLLFSIFKRDFKSFSFSIVAIQKGFENFCRIFPCGALLLFGIAPKSNQKGLGQMNGSAHLSGQRTTVSHHTLHSFTCFYEKT